MSKKGQRGTQRKCQDCGAFNDLSAGFCGQCGVALERGEESGRGSGKWEPSYRSIIGIVVVILAIGFALKMATSSRDQAPNRTPPPQTSTWSSDPIDAQVQLVASNFRCACGGCGELPLVECQCDMPRGALEEKGFIRDKLKQGYTVDQVIQSVEEEYGLRMTS